MKKIPTVFVRDEKTHRVTPIVMPGCEWVLEGRGVPTLKWDGTACMARGGKLYKRYEWRSGRPIPDEFVPAQDSVEFGRMIGWVPVSETDPADQYHRFARATYLQLRTEFKDWTYELIGPKIQGNPYGCGLHWLLPHGTDVLREDYRSYDQLCDYLAIAGIEGIVWWEDITQPDCRKAKLKAKDFGHEWIARFPPPTTSVG